MIKYLIQERIRPFALCTLDIDMWDIVENDYELPKILIDGIVQPKVKSLWIEEERKKHLLAFKVKWIISNYLTPNEYESISNYTIAKEVCDTLEVAYIRTTQVKASKIQIIANYLSPNEYERISNCTTAQEVCDTLEVAYIRTIQVKVQASKI